MSCKGGTGSFRYGNKQVDWLGWPADSCFRSVDAFTAFSFPEWERPCKRETNHANRSGMKFIPGSCKHHLRVGTFGIRIQSNYNLSIRFRLNSVLEHNLIELTGKFGQSNVRLWNFWSETQAPQLTLYDDSRIAGRQEATRYWQLCSSDSDKGRVPSHRGRELIK